MITHRARHWVAAIMLVLLVAAGFGCASQGVEVDPTKIPPLPNPQLEMVLRVNVGQAVRSALVDLAEQLRDDPDTSRMTADMYMSDEQDGLVLVFAKQAERDGAVALLAERLPNYDAEKTEEDDRFLLLATPQEEEVTRIVHAAVDQSLPILRDRLQRKAAAKKLRKNRRARKELRPVFSLTPEYPDRILLRARGLLVEKDVRDVIRLGPRFEFKLMDAKAASSADVAELLAPHGATPPPGYRVYVQEHPLDKKAFFLLRDLPELTGKHIVAASAHRSTMGEWSVAVVFDEKAAAILAEITGNNVNRRIPILLDNRVLIAPIIRYTISKEALISGNFDENEARTLAFMLGLGAFPAGLEVVSAQGDGPSARPDNP